MTERSSRSATQMAQTSRPASSSCGPGRCPAQCSCAQWFRLFRKAFQDLAGIPVFLAAGRGDPYVPPEGTNQLAAMLKKAGADLTLRWSNRGHQLDPEEIDEAKIWLSTNFS